MQHASSRNGSTTLFFVYALRQLIDANVDGRSRVIC